MTINGGRIELILRGPARPRSRSNAPTTSAPRAARWSSATITIRFPATSLIPNVINGPARIEAYPSPYYRDRSGFRGRQRLCWRLSTAIPFRLRAVCTGAPQWRLPGFQYWQPPPCSRIGSSVDGQPAGICCRPPRYGAQPRHQHVYCVLNNPISDPVNYFPAVAEVYSLRMPFSFLHALEPAHARFRCDDCDRRLRGRPRAGPSAGSRPRLHLWA